MKKIQMIFSTAIIALMHGNAFAQTADINNSATTEAGSAQNTVEEIIVTAQKRSENLQDVPISVVAVTSNQLEKVGVDDLTKLTISVPGLNVTNTYGRLTPSLRGIGSTSVGPGVENPIALYVDGVYYASSASSVFSLNNISQIEVLKGPQGTLFGRNATGGLIQVFTRDPGEDLHAELRGGFANYNTFIGSAYLSGAIADDVAGDLAVFGKHQGKGWGKQLPTGRDVYDVDHDIAVRSKLVFTPGSNSKFTLIGDYSNLRDTMVPSNLRPDSISPFLPGVQPGTGYDTRADNVGIHLVKSGGVSLRGDVGFGSIDFSSISAYRKSNTQISGDVDAVEQNFGSFFFKQFDEQFSQELQIASNSGSHLKWSAGVFYFDAKTGYEPFYLPLVFANVQYVFASSKQRIKSVAAYAQATYEIAPDTNLTLGGRYTSEKHTIYDSSIGFTGPLDAPSTAPQFTLPSDSKRDNEPTWRASLDHKITSNMLVYASYNRGFKAGGYSVSTPGVPGYDPETLDAFEIGIKSELFDRRLRFNIATFYNLYKDVQVQRYGDSLITINGAKAKTYGVEFDVAASLSNNLSLQGGFTYAHATFSDFPNCVISAANGGVPLFGGDCSGLSLPIAPRVTSNLSLDYGFEAAGGKIDLNGNIYYNSGYYTDIANNIRQNRYAKLGLYAQWTSASQRYSVRLYGENLTNRRVYVYGDSQGNGSMIVNYGEPRTYGVALSVKY